MTDATPAPATIADESEILRAIEAMWLSLGETFRDRAISTAADCPVSGEFSLRNGPALYPDALAVHLAKTAEGCLRRAVTELAEPFDLRVHPV